METDTIQKLCIELTQARDLLAELHNEYARNDYRNSNIIKDKIQKIDAAILAATVEL